ncbi:MAG: cytochrome c oxidase subunit 3, partial [Saprospiraceae bacterium]
LTSAYVVRQAQGNWLEFRLPDIFFFNTAVILLSSITLQMSYVGFKQGKELQYKLLLIISVILGFLFLICQYLGWTQLAEIGVALTGNPGGSFIYVISGIHAAHVLAGIGALLTALIFAFALPFKVTEIRRHRFDLVLQFWHFVDILWIYLILFFVFQK